MRKSFKDWNAFNFMRKLSIFLFLCLFLINFSYALDCQYDEPVYTRIETNVSYYHGEKLDFHILEVKDIISEGWWNGIWPDQKREAGFTVFNNYDETINATVLFTNNGAEDAEILTIDALGFSKVNRGTTGNILIETIRLKFEDNEVSMTTETKDVETGRICEICPSGKQCLDDGESCTMLSGNSNECGSKICNINLICGTIGTPSIVSCPSGYNNCNNESCLKINGKDFPEGYKCEFECLYGGEGGKCLENPEVVQSRLDEEARAKKEYEDGVIRNWIIFGSIVIILLSMGIWWFAFYKKKKEEEVRMREENLTKDTIVMRNNAKNELNGINDEIERINILIISLKKEEIIIKKWLENSKKEYEDKVQEIKEKEGEIRDKSKKRIQELEKTLEDKEDVTRKVFEKRIKEERKEMEDELNEIKELKENNSKKRIQEEDNQMKKMDMIRIKNEKNEKNIREEYENKVQEIKEREEEIRDKSKKRIQELEKMLQTKEGVAKREVEKEIKKERKRREDELNEINKEYRMEKERLKERDKKLTGSMEALKKKEGDLKKKEGDLKKGEGDLEKRDKEFQKPRHSKTRGFMEWNNPETSNYPCYWNGVGKNNTLEIHKDLAEKEIFNQYPEFFNKYYPNKKFKDLLVHHIDKDINNYDINNLIIISKRQHRWLHKDIIHKNRESGIKALNGRGVKAPHISELKE